MDAGSGVGWWVCWLMSLSSEVGALDIYIIRFPLVYWVAYIKGRGLVYSLGFTLHIPSN